MKSIAFIKFLDAKDEPRGKTYTYIIDDSMKKILEPSLISNRVNAYHITNNSGYNYRGAKVVCAGTGIISDEKFYDLTGLKQIITAEYAEEVDYPKSNRIQDAAKAREEFNKTYKKSANSDANVAINTDSATVFDVSRDGMKTCVKSNGVWEELFKPFEVSLTIDNEALDNSLWKILNTPATTTEKISGVGLTSDKLATSNLPTSSDITNAGRIKTDSNTVVGTITNAPWNATGSTTINSAVMEKNYLKINNTSKINIEEKKEKKSMFENLMKDLHFGKADPKMSIYGPAFLAQGICAKEYTAYDKTTNRWMDVTDMTFDFPTFMMPVAKDNIKSGDYIGHRGPNGNYEWVRVMKISDNVINAESPSRHEVISILPTRNMFGFDFYTKLIVPFDMGSTFGGASASNPFGMLPMLMMMNDKDKSGSDDNSMLMVMMMMQNGGMDFTSNPMMLYALMGDKGGDNSMLMAMLMGQMMQGAPAKCACNCDHD